MFELFTSNLWILTPTTWVCFTTYLTWYFTRAKRFSPVTPAEARQLWTIHKQTAHCEGKKWRQVRNANQTVGFQCECGYTHVQKKPLVAHAPATLTNQEITAFDRLHTSHKSA